MQHEVTDRRDLLDDRGRLQEPGFARGNHRHYDRGRGHGRRTPGRVPTVGHGFSDRTSATEMAPWRLRGTDGRVDLVLEPTVDRSSDTDLWVIRSDQHQVFGRFPGTVTLDDDTRVRVDGLPGFAEEVADRW